VTTARIPLLDNPDLTRRRLFALGGTGLGAATAGFLLATLRFVIPNVVYEPARRFDIGPPRAYTPDSVTFLLDERLYVFNGARGFYCISSVCTHLGCNVKREGTGFECPCHGSRFDRDGRVIDGPAPQALAWYALSLSPRGRLVVDVDQQVDRSFRLQV